MSTEVVSGFTIHAAAYSLANVLAGVPGMYVTTDDGDIVVHVNEDSVEEDRNKLKQLAAKGWERWKVRIEGSL